MALVGTAVGLLAWALGLPSPLALGLFAALVEFVPLVGPILSAVPILLFALAQGGTTVVWALAGVVLIQRIEGNAIQPLLGEALADVPALLLRLGIVAFGVLLGLVLAAPIAVVAFVAAPKPWVRETLGRQVPSGGGGGGGVSRGVATRPLSAKRRAPCPPTRRRPRRRRRAGARTASRKAARSTAG